MTTILVTGGRDFANYTLFARTLDDIHTATPIAKIIHGGCTTGADAMVATWLIRDHWVMSKEKILVDAHPADWTTHRKAAGPIRNQQMVNLKPDLVVAFPTGGPGTRGCIAMARKAGLSVRVIT